MTKGFNARQAIAPLSLGFLASSFQIVLLREFAAHFYGNEISVGLLLGCWLLWGGLGSLAAGKISFTRTKTLLLYYAAAVLFFISLLALRFSRFALGTLPGEMTGAVPMLVFSLILTLFVSLPLGILFVFNVHLYNGNLPRVYLLESLGGSAAGLLLYFVFIPFLSNWQAGVIAGSLAVFCVALSLGKPRGIPGFAVLLILLVASFFFDVPSQKISWRPFHLRQSKDSRYGKLQVIEIAEQFSLFDNSMSVFSYPDLSSAEESVHFAMLQFPAAREVLLIGGGVAGCVKQALKYPSVHIDYVELDPDVIRISRSHLPAREMKVLDDDRVRVHYQDGRFYLSRTEKKYDVIILNLPEPYSAQLNRFYTLEFFRIVRSRLESRGIFSFRIPSAENYISPALQNFLSSLFFTLKEIFPAVALIPGDTNIFLASENALSLGWREMAERIEELHLANTYVVPSILSSRLSPLRMDRLKQAVLSGQRKINRDLVPISYFFNSVLWSTRFGGLESRLFTRMAKVKKFWLLDAPLILYLLILLYLSLRSNPSRYLLTPIAVMGFTSIVTEILLIIAYQAFNGYLYQRIALLIATFMVGLSCGAYVGTRKREARFSLVLLAQTGFIILLALCAFALQAQPPESMFFLFLFGLGFLGGVLFVISNRLFLRIKRNYGLGYGIDLLGSFAGAIAVSSVLIPLVGLHLLLRYLLLVNSFCFIFLIRGRNAADGI